MMDRQIETVRAADQYQLLKINVRSSYLVDLLTLGFSIRDDRETYFAAVGRAR